MSQEGRGGRGLKECVDSNIYGLVLIRGGGGVYKQSRTSIEEVILQLHGTL